VTLNTVHRCPARAARNPAAVHARAAVFEGDQARSGGYAPPSSSATSPSSAARNASSG
jgi:hypothetical protein